MLGIYPNVNYDGYASHMGVGTQTGYSVVQLRDMKTVSGGFLNDSKQDTIERFSSQCSNLENRGFKIVELLRSSNIIALVGEGSKQGSSLNEVILYDEASHKIVTKKSFPSEILNVKFISDKVIVVVLHRVYICFFDSHSSKIFIESSYETSPNAFGVMSCAGTNSGIAAVFPAKLSGQIQYFETGSCHRTAIISAHETAIDQLAFHPDGTMFSSCSTKGTLVRIWNSKNCTLLFEYRRGYQKCMIESMAFAKTHLAIVSQNYTIHLLQIPSINELLTSQSKVLQSPHKVSLPKQNDFTKNDYTSLQNQNKLKLAWSNDRFLICLSFGNYWKFSIKKKGLYDTLHFEEYDSF